MYTNMVHDGIYERMGYDQMRLKDETKEEMDEIKRRHSRKSLDAVLNDILLPVYRNHNKSGLEIALQEVETVIRKNQPALGDSTVDKFLRDIAVIRKEYSEKEDHKEPKDPEVIT